MASEGKFAHSNFLRPASGLWALGAWVKNALYDRSYLPIVRLPIPVISVGSLSAGGSGKTPLVHLLAKTLQPYGQLALFSRGYRAKESGLELGDELQMLKNRLQRGLFYAGKNRAVLGSQAVAEGAEAILLDDGFQYRKLHRDFELVILDASNPFGYGAHLPRGLLRDSLSQLRRADILFLHGEGEVDLSLYTKAPVIRVKSQVRRVLGLETRKAVSLKDAPVGAFCAIAQPKRFFETLQRLGTDCLDRWILSDHAKPDPRALQEFARRCKRKGARFLVCTEKDAVKLSAFQVCLPLVFLEMELEITSNQPVWQSLIEKIALKMNNQAI